MEREELIAKLKEVQGNLEPGNSRIFHYEYVINMLKYMEKGEYGHAAGDLRDFRVSMVKRGFELLGIDYDGSGDSIADKCLSEL